MENTISFDLVSPEQLIFSDNVGMVIFPGKEGDIGVLPGHSKLLTSLRAGRVLVYDQNKKLIKSFFITSGFAEINPKKCIILVEEVEEVSNLDKNSIEKEIKNFENQNTEDARRQYLIAKLKLEALDSKLYEKF